MEIKMYDMVLLKDNREGTIVEIYDNGKAFEVDILIDNTGEYPEYETETVKAEDIKLKFNNKDDILKYRKIHQYSFENEKKLEGQECVCLYCKSKFNYNKIKLWIEDEKGKTAQCPYCEIDCVVPISIENEYKLTDKDIENLNKIYF